MEKSGEKVANWGEEVGISSEKEGWDGWKTGVRRLPKKGEGCKTLKKMDEMTGKQLCAVAKGVRVARQCWKKGSDGCQKWVRVAKQELRRLQN